MTKAKQKMRLYGETLEPFRSGSCLSILKCWWWQWLRTTSRIEDREGTPLLSKFTWWLQKWGKKEKAKGRNLSDPDKTGQKDKRTHHTCTEKSARWWRCMHAWTKQGGYEFRTIKGDTNDALYDDALDLSR